jgi:hypothetical protein
MAGESTTTAVTTTTTIATTQAASPAFETAAAAPTIRTARRDCRPGGSDTGEPRCTSRRPRAAHTSGGRQT